MASEVIQGVQLILSAIAGCFIGVIVGKFLSKKNKKRLESRIVQRYKEQDYDFVMEGKPQNLLEPTPIREKTKERVDKPEKNPPKPLKTPKKTKVRPVKSRPTKK